ncbi:hypothetical protein ACFSCW_15270 [Sphingomonas tabacisoli]|uniref:Nucleotidyltransferase domain-containing protein n=1 Tax=Sphingomonas tabacisoli TaxID=2249466 RepID=A0ABW4I5B2_9SPHN
MRLTSREISTIKAVAAEVFGPEAVVRLFGSRVDDVRKGGDIDLHVETDPASADFDHEIKFRARLWETLDEPQVDVVVAARGAEPRWIDRAAFREGVIL